MEGHAVRFLASPRRWQRKRFAMATQANQVLGAGHKKTVGAAELGSLPAMNLQVLTACPEYSGWKISSYDPHPWRGKPKYHATCCVLR